MLEQNEAPDLPRHIPISTLTSHRLRGLVIGAHRRYLNCINRTPLRRLQQPQITREITVSPRFPEPDPHSWSEPELLPGGALFLVVCRPAREVGTNQYLGFLRCFNVPGGECVWTYQPDELDVRGFGYDMQANGDVHVLTESGPVFDIRNNDHIGPR
ncbi:hypothetical protein DFH11DRAFT_1861175 [Phellopilus nigrolimitatus]|nr:hypothetical protein DFH11DRAFT_1861175 [Phellopilus nigrolimitatus]